jgi:hypothetical protein
MILTADLAIYQGDDWAALVTVYQADGVTAANLAGYSAQAQIRSGPADQQTVVAAEILCTIVLPNQISLSLTHQQTAQLGEQWYQWDLQLVSAAGVISTILAGQVDLSYETTRESTTQAAVVR